MKKLQKQLDKDAKENQYKNLYTYQQTDAKSTKTTIILL